MYRVYSEEFYQNPDIKKTYENNYVKAITDRAEKTNAKIDKNSDASNLLTITENKIKEFHDVCEKYDNPPELPNNLKELLIISPEKMAKIYCFFRKNKEIQEKYKTIFNSVFREGKEDDSKNRYHTESPVLDYDFYDDLIAKHIISTDYNKLLTLKTCFYCNHAYINVYQESESEIELNENKKKKNEKIKRQFDLDHFITKGKKNSICPFFSLSLYNFVPSCHLCNSTAKGEKEFFNKLNPKEIEKVFPTSENYAYDKSLKFHIIPTKKFYIQENNSYDFKELEDYFKIDIEEKDDDSKLYTEELKSFDILDRYKPHIKEFLSYIDKARKYPPSYFILMSKNDSEGKSSGLYEAIFDKNFREEYQPIFRKIYSDIDDDLS